ncbi:hypothetical protein C8R44DRAFT_739400 [Mycena epipterygia]|nr:hypothetical protein C8R44DRAFT_739400 [Mycena epipterygia]
MYSEDFYISKILQAKVVGRGTRNTEKHWVVGGVPGRNVGNRDSSYFILNPEHLLVCTRWAVKTFWKRADLASRDYKQLSYFKPARNTRPGLGRSSAGLITGTHVFALWREDSHYYSAVVQQCVGSKYVVRFDDDDTEATVPLKHMRPCSKLEEGDSIILKSDNAKVSKIKSDGSFTIERVLALSSIKISAYDVEEKWQDCMLSHVDIVCAMQS